MGSQPKPKPPPEPFLETARALGCDEDEGALDPVFGKVVPPVVPKAAEKPDEKKDE